VESQVIRAHVPAVLRTFNQSWQAVFREGVVLGLRPKAALRAQLEPWIPAR
jgi:hypothetical protein